MDNIPHVLIGACHNVYIRQMHFQNSGYAETQHTHSFDHITLLSKGSLEVVCNNQTTVFHAPHMIYIRADYVHGMTALEDDTLAYCIHGLHNTPGKVIDDMISNDMIPNGSSLSTSSIS
jgi:quercetin dioxygenase-like cupin family protein